MAHITMKRIDGAMVTPKDDACLYERAIGASGMMYGADISYLGASQVHISEGKGIYKGRDFDIAEQTINVQLSDTGEKKGRIYIHIDLSNAEKPIDILSITANTLPPLVESDNFNETMGTGEMELATYTAGEVSITNLTETFVYIGNPYEKMEERVGELEGDINQLNQNLGGLSFYEDENGDKWVRGADSVWVRLGIILPKKITYYYDYSNNSFSGWTNSTSVAAGKYLVDVHIGHRSGNNYVCNLSSGQKLLGQSGTYGSSSLYILDLDKETVVTASCTCSYTGASDGFGGWVVYVI